MTHAGGPVPMPTEGWLLPSILTIYSEHRSGNPIDMIATATDEQLDTIISYVDMRMPLIDGMIVIFGSNGLNDMAVNIRPAAQENKGMQQAPLSILPSFQAADQPRLFPQKRAC